MNLPNKLTCLRMVMVPFFVAAMVIPFPHHHFVALVLFTPLSAAFGLIYLPAKLYLIGLGLILVPLVVMELTKAIGLIRHHK